MNQSTKLNPSSSTSTNLTFGADGEEWTLFEMGLTLFLGGTSVTTIAGNSLILYLFLKSKRSLRSPTHWLIANLAIADLCVGAGVMPALISVTLSNLKWYLGEFACKGNEYFHFALCAASLLSMMGIGVERYIGVKFPLRHKRILTRRRVLGVIVIIWIVALLLTATPLTVWPIRGERRPMYCPINLRSDFVLFISICVYWIPVFVTGFMYWLIYRRAIQLYIPSQIDKTPGRIHHTNSYNSESVLSTGTMGKCGKFDPERFQKTKKKQTKLAKKLSYIVVIMLLLYAPLFTVLMLIAWDPSWISLHLLLICGWIRYCSSCANPFLYIIVIPGYKKAFLKTVWNEKRRNGNEATKSESKTGSNTESNNSPSGGRDDVVFKDELVHKRDMIVSNRIQENGSTDFEHWTQMPNLSPISQETLIGEIRSFLNAIKERPLPAERTASMFVKNRASQLLENVLLFSPTLQWQRDRPMEKKEIRKSQNSSVGDRTPVNDIGFELDEETAQELQDIIAQLESLEKS